MRKTILIGLCMILLISITVHAFPYKKTVMGYGFNITYDGTPSNVEIVYNYTNLLSHIDDEGQVYVCKWFQQYERWIPMRDAIKNLNNNTVKYFINNAPQQWALCLINSSATCAHRPNATSFTGSSTNFGAIATANMDSVSPLVLEKNSGTINWSTSTYDVCGAPLDTAVNMSGSHASIDAYVLSTTLDSEAVVTLGDVDCTNFNLYYAGDYYTILQDIIDNGDLVATELNIGGDCTDTDICIDVACIGNTLTFTAKHFDSFGEEPDGEGGPAPIPEFSIIGLIFAIIIAVIGLSLIIKNKK